MPDGETESLNRGDQTLQGSGKDGSWILLSMAVTATLETNSIAVRGPEVSTRWNRGRPPGLRREREVSFFSFMSFTCPPTRTIFSLPHNWHIEFHKNRDPSKQFLLFFFFLPSACLPTPPPLRSTPHVKAAQRRQRTRKHSRKIKRNAGRAARVAAR